MWPASWPPSIAWWGPGGPGLSNHRMVLDSITFEISMSSWWNLCPKSDTLQKEIAVNAIPSSEVNRSKYVFDIHIFMVDNVGLLSRLWKLLHPWHQHNLLRVLSAITKRRIRTNCIVFSTLQKGHMKRFGIGSSSGELLWWLKSAWKWNCLTYYTYIYINTYIHIYIIYTRGPKFFDTLL